MSAPRRIVILGASGGCVDILNTILEINQEVGSPRYECVGLLDDDPALAGRTILGAKVLGPFASAPDYAADCGFVTGIGNPDNFWNKPDVIAGLGLPAENFETIVHPTASVSSWAAIGRGCVIHQHAAITTHARLGDHVLVLPNATVSHDTTVGDCSIVTAGASISGNVGIGRACYIGANSAIREYVKIGAHSLIGMGSVVLHDVPANSVVVGNPARRIRSTGG